MTRHLRDKVIAITGASSGIGHATALACARQGMHVVIAARRRDQLDALATQIQQLGSRAHVVVCDVNSDDDVRQLFDAVRSEFGRLDAVFANAGYGLALGVLDTPDDQHRDIFETNYFGTVRTLQHATPLLRETGDGLRHVLICSSAASEIAPPYFGPYSATKAAQDALAAALRAEVAHENIHVTSVHPVGTTSEFFQTTGKLSNRTFAESTPNTPSILAQTPKHVARAILSALRRPRPEVWPSPLVRFSVALLTAFPRLSAYVMRRRAAEFRQLHDTTTTQQEQP